MGVRCFIFDIDGTIADLTHRLHHITQKPANWPAFFALCENDTPIQHVCDVAISLRRMGHQIVFVTGRSTECQRATEAWLRDALKMTRDPVIYMRAEGDHRADTEVKGELLDRLLADGFEPVMVFEDRQSVVDMWRARGIPCAQVAEGNF